MARINDIATSWTTVGPTAARELWQCVKGQVFVSTDGSVPTGESGILLRAGEAREVSSGLTVHYRARYENGSAIERALL